MANLKFTNTGTSSTTVTLSAVGSPQKNIFSANNSPYTLGTLLSLSAGESVQFSGQGNNLSLNEANYYKFIIAGTGTVALSGDLNALIGNSNYVKRYQFVNLFKDCTNISDISNLAFPTTVADFCYSNMFLNCTGLLDASTTLPAVNLSRWCYNGMFGGCSNLSSAPTINATKVAPFCYYNMFCGCSNLKDAPAIITRTMNGQFTCNGMFRNCNSLSSVTVSITNWSTGQNENKNWLNGVAPTGIFYYPNTLASIPAGVKPTDWDEVATYPSIINVESQTFSFDAMSDTVQLKELAYSYNGEETVTVTPNLTNKPSWLTVTTDSDSINFSANGYAIDSDTSFEIPITFSATDAESKSAVATFNIANYPVYTITFDSIPNISWNFEEATTSSVNLEQYVNYGGSTLSTEITGLPEGVVYQNGILSANKDLMGGNVNTTFDLVASASDARTATSSNIGLNIEGLLSPLTFTAKSATASIALNQNNSPDPLSMQYSKNGGAWTNYTVGDVINLDSGDRVAFINSTNTFSKNGANYYRFAMTGTIEAKGNIQSLMNWSDDCTNVCYYRLFLNCTGLVTPPDLPATGLATACYNSMFAGCTSLTAAPQLPATTLAEQCYYYMFNGCTSLVTAPSALPATTLANMCYALMFQGCTALTAAPNISGNLLAEQCCYYMFSNCTNLLTGPEIATTSLVRNDSLGYMFESCSSLSSVKVHFTYWNDAQNCTSMWFYNVNNSSDSKFYCPAGLDTSTRNYSKVPQGWTVVNY